MVAAVAVVAAMPRALSEAQRQIVSATFNVIRDRDTFSEEEYRENLVFLTLAQGRLREQVETLLRRMKQPRDAGRPGVPVDSRRPPACGD